MRARLRRLKSWMDDRPEIWVLGGVIGFIGTVASVFSVYLAYYPPSAHPQRPEAQGAKGDIVSGNPVSSVLIPFATLALSCWLLWHSATKRTQAAMRRAFAAEQGRLEAQRQEAWGVVGVRHDGVEPIDATADRFKRSVEAVVRQRDDLSGKVDRIASLEADVEILAEEKRALETELEKARADPAVLATAIKRRLALRADGCDALYRKVRVARDHLAELTPQNAEATSRYVKAALDDWEEFRLSLERDLRSALEPPALRAFPSDQLSAAYANGEVSHWNARLQVIKDTEAYLRVMIDNLQPHHRRPEFHGWADA
jgi:hypothetical protein